MPSSKGVPVKIGGAQRILRYNARALDRLETETGLSLGQIQTRVAMGAFKHSVTLIWVGLLHAEKELERDTVLDWLDDLEELEPLVNSAADALALAFGNPLPSELQQEGEESQGKETAASAS